MPVAELEKLAPSFGWRSTCGRGAPAFDSLNVAVPEFMKTLEERNRRGESGRLEELPFLARGSRRRAAAGQRVRDENFECLGKTLTGARNCGRAGSAAWRGPTTNSAKRWAGFRRARVRRRGKKRVLEMGHALERALPGTSRAWSG